MGHVPISIRRDNVVDPELLTDLFDTKMQCICLKLLIGHICHDQSRESHQTRCLVFLGIAPSVPLLALLDSIDRWFSYGTRVNTAWYLIDGQYIPRTGLLPRLLVGSGVVDAGVDVWLLSS